MAIKMAFFYRGHFSLRRMCLFLKNYTFSTAKRVIFRRRIMTGGYFSTSKNDPVIFRWGSLFFFTPAYRRHLKIEIGSVDLEQKIC